MTRYVYHIKKCGFSVKFKETKLGASTLTPLVTISLLSSLFSSPLLFIEVLSHPVW